MLLAAGCAAHRTPPRSPVYHVRGCACRAGLPISDLMRATDTAFAHLRRRDEVTVGGSAATATSKACATSPTGAPPTPLIAAILAAVALAGAARYAVRVPAWQVLR